MSINPNAALLCVLVFVIVLLTTHYVSLSSICAGFVFPIVTVFVFPSSVKSEVLYGISVCLLILVTHQKNIERLLKGKESKVYLYKKK